jgi:hypothetical protein
MEARSCFDRQVRIVPDIFLQQADTLSHDALKMNNTIYAAIIGSCTTIIAVFLKHWLTKPQPTGQRPHPSITSMLALGFAITALVVALFSATRGDITTESGVIRIRETQICWGTSEPTTSSAQQKSFEFKFNRQFVDNPQVILSIHPTYAGGSQISWSELKNTITSSNCAGEIRGIFLGAPPPTFEMPLRVDYMAIGKWRN